MQKPDIKNRIEGYADILRENETLRKYALDRTVEKGAVAAAVNRLPPPGLKLRVARIVSETASTKTLRLVTADGGRLRDCPGGRAP